MSFTAQPLVQAREALVAANQEKVHLIAQVEEQAQQIAELYRELQKQIASTASALQALAEARAEIDRLRAELPDEATRAAYNALSQIVGLAGQSEQRTSEAGESSGERSWPSQSASGESSASFADETRSARIAA